MNIVIIGAGEIGLHVATMLSKQKENVILIDKNRDKLAVASTKLDIATKIGSGTDWELLDDLLEMKPDLLLALTDSDEVNLVACNLAKHLGYPLTVCRVKDNRFLNRSRLDFARLFNADYFISPELLVAYEMYKYLLNFHSLFFENLSQGALQVRTITMPETWSDSGKKLKHLHLPSGVMIALIHRFSSGESTLIFPHGDDHISPGDEVTFIGKQGPIANIHNFFGLQLDSLGSVVILGGSEIGMHLAKILAGSDIDFRIIDKDLKKCEELATKFPKYSVLHHDGTDFDFLLSEKLGYAEYLFVCTHHDETNVLSALVAKKAGCQHVIVVLSDHRFIPLLNQLGIVHVISPQAATAQRIASLATTHTINELITLHNEAQIVELTVSMNCQIVGIPLADAAPLFPKECLLVTIQSRGHINVAKGDSVICPGDTVTIICRISAVNTLRAIF